MSSETQVLIRICEQLREAQRIEVADFARFLRSGLRGFGFGARGRRAFPSRSRTAASEATFEGAESPHPVVDGDAGGAARESDEEHFERGARLPASHDVVVAGRETLVQSHEIVRVSGSCVLLYLAGFFGGKIE